MHQNSAVATLGALATDTRLRTVQLLAAAGENGLPAGEIARRLTVPQNTMSDHLATLTRAGVLNSERQRTSIIYRLNGSAIQDLLGFLQDNCTARGG